MKVAVEICIGVMILALIPLVFSSRMKNRDQLINVHEQGGNRDSYSLTDSIQTEQPTKSNSYLSGSTRIRVDEILELYGPVYDFDEPSDGYFAGWMKVRESQEEGIALTVKMRLLGEGYSFLSGVELAEPEWKPQLVERKIVEIRSRLKKSLLAEQGVPAKSDRAGG